MSIYCYSGDNNMSSDWYIQHCYISSKFNPVNILNKYRCDTIESMRVCYIPIMNMGMN